MVPIANLPSTDFQNRYEQGEESEQNRVALPEFDVLPKLRDGA